MRAQKVFDNNKLIGYVYFFLDYDPRILDEEKFIKKLVSGLDGRIIGFAGLKSKKYLREYLQLKIFDNKRYTKLPEYNFDKGKIFHIVRDALVKCHKELPSKPTRVFLFPSFGVFVKNRLGGVGGFSFWENTVLIDINPTVKGWEAALRDTVSHEYNHSVVFNFHKLRTLLDGLIFEGFAEHFREEVVGGEGAPWTKAVSPRECRKYFTQLKGKFNSKSHKLYREVFWGTGKYPLWLGYSLGYNIVESFLKKNQDKSWAEIVKASPQEVLKKSLWI